MTLLLFLIQLYLTFNDILIIYYFETTNKSMHKKKRQSQAWFIQTDQYLVKTMVAYIFSLLFCYVCLLENNHDF